MTLAQAIPDPRKQGEAIRKTHPRNDLAQWDAQQRRQKPLVLLQHAMHGRVPALAALKLERMRVNAFGFFRGAVPIMAYDLSLGASTGILVQLCGDAHVQNLGSYTAPDGSLVFDINDFDETLPGPFEWDLKRMATSILLAGDGAGMKQNACIAPAEAFLASYLQMMERFSRMPVLEVARYQVRRLGGVAPVAGILKQAARATPVHLLEHLTEPARRGRRFRTQKPLLRRVRGKDAQAVLTSLNAYLQTLQPERRHFLTQYRAVDVAFKVVGTGSVGLRDYVIYFEGNPQTRERCDPLFLQIKEEAASAYAPYLSSAETHQGRRAVDGQRAMQLQSDPLLGWTELDGRDYLVRQLNDHKASIDLARIKPAALTAYAQVCGELLARGHARSGDARVIAGYCGVGKRFRGAMLTFAKAYAEQTVEDWKELCKSSKKPQTD